jgi:hypothetical protein
MTKYVRFDNLNRAFVSTEYKVFWGKPTDVKKSIQLTDEFKKWWADNNYLIAEVHTEYAHYSDSTHVVFEFYKEEDALICILKWS